MFPTDPQKHLTDQLGRKKVIAHFYASFVCTWPGGLVRTAVKVGPTEVLNSGETDAGLDTDLRSLWTLVAFSARCRPPDHCSVFPHGGLPRQAALVRACGRCYGRSGCPLRLYHAVVIGWRQLSLRRFHRHIEYRLDCGGCCLPV